MNVDDELDGLKRIRRVDAPPFLYTRIRARLDALADAPAPVQWVWSFVAATLLVLTLNVGAFLTATDQTNTQSPAVANVVKAMQLAPSNYFYHD